ncbi:MAG: hypothetical protein AMDU3_IPLC00004G0015 [Thermoplasmatales archaeon I-plasma]|jgi:hypothetical protein|nr:MAG: hypothetical protein AMDU3_IPLC00004G0015 [Thermoplasmatales archaeon I-plasma]
MSSVDNFSSEDEARSAVEEMKLVREATSDKALPKVYITSVNELLSASKSKVRLAFFGEVAKKCPDLLEFFEDIRPKKITEKKTEKMENGDK